MSEQNQIVPSNGLAITSFDDMEKVGKLIAGGGMFGIQNPAQAICLMLICHSEGLNPIEALKRYHIIQGRPSRRADSILADFESKGGAVIWHARTDEMVGATFFADRKTLDEKARDRAKERFGLMWDLVNEDDYGARADLINKIGQLSHEGEETLIRTLQDAIAKGIAGHENKLKDNWRQSPRQMLTARTVTEAVRIVKASVIAGMSTDDETKDQVEQEHAKVLTDAFGPEPASEMTIDDLRREYEEVQAKIGLASPNDRTPLYELRSRLQVKIEEYEGAAAASARTANAAPETTATVSEPEKATQEPPKTETKPEEPPAEFDWKNVTIHVGTDNGIKGKTVGAVFVDGDLKTANTRRTQLNKAFIPGYLKTKEGADEGKHGPPMEQDTTLYKALIQAFDHLDERNASAAKAEGSLV